MIDPETLTRFGLPGLFVVAFLAGSVVPIPSEAVLAALIYGRTPPVLAVAVAVGGNVLGALTLYWLGQQAGKGGEGRFARFVARVTKREPARLELAKARLARWGPPVLLLSWMPLVGDVFVLAAGFVGVKTLPFVVFTACGKGLRYAFVAVSVAAAMT